MAIESPIFDSDLEKQILDILHLCGVHAASVAIRSLKDADVVSSTTQLRTMVKSKGTKLADYEVSSDGDGLFYIGSLTQLFIAIAVIIAVEVKAKEHTPNNPYSRFSNAEFEPLTDLYRKYSDDSIDGLPGNPTIIQLLVHFRGLDSSNSRLLTSDGLPIISMTDAQQSLLRNIERGDIHSDTPDERMRYSDLNYAVIIMAIEALWGRTLDTFMEETLFTPLGMKSTSIGVSTDGYTDVDGWVVDSNGHPSRIQRPNFGSNRSGARSPGGFSTSRDLDIFFNFILSSLHGSEVIPGVNINIIAQILRIQHKQSTDHTFTPLGLYTQLTSTAIGSLSSNRLQYPDETFSTYPVIPEPSERRISAYYMADSSLYYSCATALLPSPSSEESFAVVVLTDTSGPVDAADHILRAVLRKITRKMYPGESLPSISSPGSVIEMVRKASARASRAWKQIEEEEEDLIRYAPRISKDILGVFKASRFDQQLKVTTADQKMFITVGNSSGTSFSREFQLIWIDENRVKICVPPHLSMDPPNTASWSNLILEVSYSENTVTELIRRTAVSEDRFVRVVAEPMITSNTQESDATPEALNLLRDRQIYGTLTSVSDSESVLARRRRNDEVEAMQRRAWEEHESTLGPEHPDTLTVISDLGLLLDSQGKHRDAEVLHKRVLETRGNLLGVEHPHTLTSKANLVSNYSHQRRWAEAEELCADIVRTRKRVLGGKHPDTLAIIKNLEIVSKCRGRQQTGIDEVSSYGGTTAGGYESLTGQTLVQRRELPEDVNYTPTAEQIWQDEDIRSLVSDEDAQSQPSIHREWQSEIESAIVSLLATNSTLTPIYERALQLMNEDRLVNNLRRLLKIFHDGLNVSSQSATMHQLAVILKSKKAQARVARKIIDRQVRSKELLNMEDPERFRGSDRISFARLEEWLAKVNLLPLETEHGKPENEYEEDSEESNSESEHEREDEGESDPQNQKEQAKFPRLDLAMQSIVEGEPFQDMVTNLKEFLLPHGLLREVISIPRENISYSSKNVHVLLGKLQGLFENWTALEWDWWPLPPRMRLLKQNETRVYWRCFCGMMRWRVLRPGQQEILEELLDQRPKKFIHHFLCASLRLSESQRSLQARVLSGSERAPGQASKQAPAHISITGQKYTPTTSHSPSLVNENSRTQPQGGDYTQQSTPGTLRYGYASSTSVFERDKELWVIFGVDGHRMTPEVDQIGSDSLQTDGKFLRELRRRHFLLRGRLRTYLSVWRLSYWEFVKFQRTLLRSGRMIVQKVDLPDSNDYEYSPRPPHVTVEQPGILRHEFELIVRSCITPCQFASFLALHDCLSIEENANYIIGKLPKKKTKYRMDAQGQAHDYVWGIQARYSVSSLRVVIVHAIIFGLSFGVWTWWQQAHPDDLQGASVPLTAAGILISTFWSSTGVLKGLR